ncbi:hypothetical protein ACGFNU_46970 [Spirillospora sp. NPDC048911]|uniref:hypothetical protein n=1 Tax=Spirillospora sp. NPDC048911 TaxID=3364527 RepID=UPI003721A04E
MILVTGATGNVGGNVVSQPVRAMTRNPRSADLPDDVEAVGGILTAHAAMVTNPEPVTSTVEQLTRTPPRTFRQWATNHAIVFGGGHQPA